MVERFVVCLRSLQWRMRCPVGQVKEERPVFVRFDDLDGFLGVVVRQVAARLKRRTTIETGREVKGGPQKPVDGVKCLSCLLISLEESSFMKLVVIFLKRLN